MEGPLPEYLKILHAVARFGVSRTKLYELAAERPGLFRKLGRATLVDCAKLRELLAALPEADVRLPSRAARRAAPQPRPS